MVQNRDWFGLAQPVSESDWDSIDVVIQGIPFEDAVGDRRGAALAPAKLRALSRDGWAVTESGELLDRICLVDAGDIRAGKDRESFSRFLVQRLGAIPSGAFPIHLGGDASVSVPLIQAFGSCGKGSCGILMLGAHPRLWDSCQEHRFNSACVLRRVLEFPFVAPRAAALVGVRSFSPAEMEFLQHNNILHVTARDFQLRGSDRCAQQIIEALYDVDRIYLSVDANVFDPAFAPGATTPVPGGLSPREVLSFLRLVFARLRIAAMDLVDISPVWDVSDLAGRLGARMVLEVLGFLQARKGRFSL
ncbi:MAG: arginase family protein [Acidobacteria bacterium]|nr:arginase family protein [Acidobacteriota bacterium]